MEEKYVALLMQKIKTNKGVYFLKPVSVIRDSVIDDNDIITDSKGKKYHSCYDFEFYLNKKENFCYSYPVSHSYLETYYKSDIFSESVLQYVSNLNKNMYFAALNSKTQQVSISLLNQDKLKDKESDLFLKEILKKYEIDEKQTIEITIPEELLDIIIKASDENQKEKVDNYLQGLKQICENAKQEIQKNQQEESKTNLISQTIEQKHPVSRKSVFEIYELLKKEVIGQDETIQKILSALAVDEFADDPNKKCRGIIVGPTGTGKTQIMRSLSNIISRPFVNVDSTQITVSGYVGGTIEDNIIKPLIEKSNGNIDVAEHGIVNLDEIDKKGSSKNNDVSGRGVLNSLLPFLDGTRYEVKYGQNSCIFDSSNLTIFASGAFTNVFDSLNEKDTSVGFNTSRVKEEKMLTRQDLIKLGNMPNEFIGRFSILSIMNNLMQKDFEDILTQSKNSQLLFMKEYLLKSYNVKLDYEDKFINEVAKKAMDLKLGGRALKTIIEESIQYARWEVLTNNSKYKELILLGETVENPKKYILK